MKKKKKNYYYFLLQYHSSLLSQVDGERERAREKAFSKTTELVTDVVGS